MSRSCNGRAACPQATAELDVTSTAAWNKQPYLFVVAALVFVSSSWAQRALTDIPNPDPAYQQSLLKPAEGFEVSLFASDPMIAKPIAMSFDAKGRLWVATSETYPQIMPGQTPSDKVYRLEDTDGDGKADKRTVFADGLLTPTAILVMPEGVYVGNSTELLFFEDKDDDGVADNKRVVLSGFGTEDTHHIVHTLRAGPAGRIYFNQSIYIHSYLETPHGIRELKAGGVWRLRPETMELDVYSRGLVNTWGFQFDNWGQTFQSDGAGSEGISHSFPGAAFRTTHGYDRILPGLNPGQPKMSGLEIISGRHFPEEWQGRIITCDFRGNRINAFKPVDSNSGFIAPQQEDLVTSTHGSFRPIDLQMGPDGALYVADWYNPIIQHGEVDFRDERRDHTHGRIWRITAKDRALVKKPTIKDASVSELLKHLIAPEAWTRTQAKLFLKDRGADAVVRPLKNWVRSLDASDSQIDAYRLEALWVSLSLMKPDIGLIDQLLSSNDFHARAAAVRALEEHPERIDGIYDFMERALADEHPRVQLEALHVLRALGGVRAASLASQVYSESMDEAFEFGLWTTMKILAPDWQSAAVKNPRLFGSDTRALLFAIRSVNQPEALEPLDVLWKSGEIEEAVMPDALELLGELGDAAIVTDVFQETLSRAERSLPGVLKVLKALEQSATKRKVVPEATASDIEILLKKGDLESRIAIARLSGAWKVKGVVGTLETLVKDLNTDTKLSLAAVEGLVSLDSSESKSALLRLGGSNQPFSTRLRAAAGYAQSSPKAAIPMVVAALSDAGPKDDARPLIRPYLSNGRMADALAKGLSGITIDGDVATVGLRLFGSVTTNTKLLQAAMQKAGGIEPLNQALDTEQMADFIGYTHANGDAARGEAIYRRDSLLCITCHALGGSGGSLGPDLTSIGASAPMDYIVDSLLQPQKKIKEGYHLVSLTKKDGSVLAGTLVKEDSESFVLRDMADQRILVAKSDVASQTISPVSLMPPGLTAPLRKDELADLVTFLSSIGKEGDYKVSSKPVVRTFRYLDDQDGSRAFADIVRHKPIEHMVTDDPRFVWLAAYARIDGLLPVAEIPSLRRAGEQQYRYFQFDLDVKSAGKIGLRFNDADGFRLWSGQEEVEGVENETRVVLGEGKQTFTLAALRGDRSNRDLSIEIFEIPGSSAQVQVVNGK